MKIAVIAESINVNDSSGSKVNVELIKNLSKICSQVVVYHYTQIEIQIQGTQCFNISENKFSLFLSSVESKDTLPNLREYPYIGL